MNRWIKKCNLLFLGLLTNSSMLLADWDPKECFFDKDLSILEEEGFTKLKTTVIDHLKDSWCSKEKASLLMDLILIEQPAVCVEVGAFTGSSSLPIATALSLLQKGTLYAVDAWSNNDAVQYLVDDDPNKDWWSKVDMDAVFNIFQEMIDTWKLTAYCKPVKQPSDQAIRDFDQIDFLHLDGDYSEIGSLRDVELYLPKVKSGGYILFSNLYVMVKGKQPKQKAFCALFESCEMVCGIDRDNAILFRKN